MKGKKFMRKTKQLIRKILLTFFSFALILNAMPMTQVFAEEGSLHVTYYDGYTNTGSTFTGYDGNVHGLLHVYGPDGVKHNVSTSGYDINGDVVFCIQPNIYTENGYYYASDGNVYNHLTDSQARRLEMISWFGYGYNGDWSPEARIATQLLIWETMGFSISGYIDSIGSKMSTISSRVNEYNNRATPSFAKNTHTLYGVGEEYAITLTDTNNAVSAWYKTSAPDGISYEISGNTIKVWANKDITGVKTINYDLIDPNDSRQNGASVVYVNPNDAQKLVRLRDPFKRYTDVSFRLVTGSFNLTKSDVEGGSDGDKATPQGDATLNGAEYALIDDRSGEIHTLTYDSEKGISNTIDHLDIRDTYTLKETKAPVGYLTDKTAYKVTFEDDGTSNVIKVRKDLFDDVIKFNLAIYKVTTDGEESESIPPVSAAEFTLTLKSSGEVVAVKETDYKGQLTFENIPYGLYTVTETKTPEGLETVKPFDFDGRISEEEHTYTFHRYANDAPFRAWVGIYKVDAETGKKIPAAGVEFKVKNIAGEYITQTVSYQTRYETDTFITNEDGFVNLPEKLLYGKYTICEIKAPYGYVLAKDEFPLNVDGTETEIFIEFENKQQYGQLHLEKFGEFFNGAEKEENKYGDLYTPTYSEQYLEGVTYEIIAREDIAFGLENYCVDPLKMDDIINKYSTLVNMSEYLDKEPSNLSGGQKQRVAIAGILAMNPSIIIFDEATSMLDPKGKEEIKKIIYDLHGDDKLTIISITHDIEEALKSDEVIILNKGQVYKHGNPKEIFKDGDALRRIGLDTPFTYQVKEAFSKKKINIKHTENIEELAEELWQLSLKN